MGRFPVFVLRGRFTSRKSTGKQPIRRCGVKRFLMLGQTSCRTKEPQNVLFFCPGFSPELPSEFYPNFLRICRSLFPSKRRPQNLHQKSPSFFNAKSPGKYEKNIHKVFLERKESKEMWLLAWIGCPRLDSCQLMAANGCLRQA